MGRFAKLVAFELRLQLSGPMVWLALSTFVGMGAYLAIAEPIQVNNVRDGLLHNGASTFLVAFSGLSILSIVIAALFVGSAVLRSNEARTTDLIHAAPVTSSAYIGAQFVAGFTLLLAVFSALILGMFVAFATPFVAPVQVGPTPWHALSVIFGVYVIPNLFFSATTVLLLVSLTRSLKYAVVGAIAILVLHSVANAVTMDHPTLGAVIDPYAGQASIRALTHWDAERLNADAPWRGDILLNRALWVAVSLGMVISVLRMNAIESNRRGPAGGVKDIGAPPTASKGARAEYRVAQGPRAEVAKFISLLKQTASMHMGALPFWLCTAAMAVLVAVYLAFSRSADGASTQHVLGAILHGSSPAYLFILGFMAGELVFGDREVGVTRLTDAFPISEAATAGSRLVCMACLVSVLNLMNVLIGVFFQASGGYTHLAPGLYAQGFLLLSLPMLTFGVASIGIQWISGNKYVGYLMTALLGLIPLGMTMAGVQNHLLVFNTIPPLNYSDMGGFDRSGVRALKFDAYWLLLALAFAWVTFNFRQRSDADPASRWRKKHQAPRQSTQSASPSAP